MSTLGKTPNVELERYALGELSPQQHEKVEAELSLQENANRLEELKESNQEILENYSPHLMATQIKARAEKDDSLKHPTPFWKILVPAVTALSAVALIWILVPSIPGGNPTSDDKEIILIKGDPTLFVFRKIANGDDELLNHNQLVKPGDVVQLKYLADGANYGAIFSTDGRGAVTLHFPAEADQPTNLKQHGSQALEFSYELDDAPVFEHFFFVISDDPIKVESLLKRAKELSSNNRSFLEFGGIIYQHDILLRKEN